MRRTTQPSGPRSRRTRRLTQATLEVWRSSASIRREPVPSFRCVPQRVPARPELRPSQQDLTLSVNMTSDARITSMRVLGAGNVTTFPAETMTSKRSEMPRGRQVNLR